MLSQALHSSGAAVQAAQQALNSMGYTGADGKPLVTDGSFGPNTTYAVRSFQSGAGLTVDGVIGPQTQAALTQAMQVPSFEIGVTDTTSGTMTPGTAVAAATSTSMVPGVPNWALGAGAGLALLVIIAIATKKKK